MAIQPDYATILYLEEALEQAKEGKITGLAMLAKTNHTSLWCYSGDFYDDPDEAFREINDFAKEHRKKPPSFKSSLPWLNI